MKQWIIDCKKLIGFKLPYQSPLYREDFAHTALLIAEPWELRNVIQTASSCSLGAFSPSLKTILKSFNLINQIKLILEYFNWDNLK